MNGTVKKTDATPDYEIKMNMTADGISKCFEMCFVELKDSKGFPDRWILWKFDI